MDKSNSHSYFQEARRGNYAWWMYLLGFVAVGFATTFGQLPLMAYLLLKGSQKYPDTYIDRIDEFSKTADWAAIGVNQNIGLALLLISFGVGLIGLIFVIRIFHNRSFKSLITPLANVNYSKIAFGFFVWIALSLGSELISYYMTPEDYVFNLQIVPFIILLIISLFLLPIQTSFEELFVRGYLMQGLGLLFRYPFIALILSSLLFAGLHMMNPEVAKYGFWTMLSYYSMAGVLLGILTVMDDSLELALGVHFATNITSALFVTYEGAALKTSALFKMINTDIEITASGFIIMSVIFLAICYKKYNWPSFTYLISKIHFHDEHDITETLVSDH